MLLASTCLCLLSLMVANPRCNNKVSAFLNTRTRVDAPPSPPPPIATDTDTNSAPTTITKPRKTHDSNNNDDEGGVFRNPSEDEITGNIYNQIMKNVNAPKLQKGMDYVRLGDSNLIVSKVCMGTMTYGVQNTLEEGIEFLNTAFDEYGINFVDTAEMYPVPRGKGEQQGDTDRIICEFLKTREREDVILATKVAGRSPGLTYLPRGDDADPKEGADLTRKQIIDSVDQSLKRLGTDYVDLLQLHWPGRYSGGLFGADDFSPSEYENQYKKCPPVELKEQLSALKELIDSGKVRYFGVSNETPFGVCAMAALSEYFPELYPKCITIQNSFSMVCRKDYEVGNAEACYHNNISLLAYSPLAGGTLSGKYRQFDKEAEKDKEKNNNAGTNANNKIDETMKPRLTRFPGFMNRYLDSQNVMAVNAYCKVAERYNLTPTQLALSWCYHSELVASTIVGATTMKQLEENIQAYDIRLDEMADGAVLRDIAQVYKRYKLPTIKTT